MLMFFKGKDEKTQRKVFFFFFNGKKLEDGTSYSGKL